MNLNANLNNLCELINLKYHNLFSSFREANKYLQETNADLQGEVGVLKRKLSKKGDKRVKNSLQDELSAFNDSGSER